MYQYSYPEIAHYVATGRRLHAEAISGQAYRAIVGLIRLLDGAPTLAVELVGRWQSWNRTRRSIADLRALDDRTLQDIGLHRSEIAATVRAAEQAGQQGEARQADQAVRLRPVGRHPVANDNPTPDLARAACG